MDFDYVVVPCLIVVVAILISWLCIRRILALRAKGYRKWRRTTERVVLSLVVLVAVAIGASTAFNALAIYHYRATIPGKFYNVHGYRMHIYCTGQGSPTLILDAGLGGDWAAWGAVQPELSKITRVCSYDRAGFGRSSARPGTRDADHIAGELHDLLIQAGITGPIILMGHSIGGLYIRDYAALYPQQVAGLVLVDSSIPLQDKTPVFQAVIARAQKPEPAVQRFLEQATLILGVPRLVGLASFVPHGWDPRVGKMMVEDRFSQDDAAEAAAAEAELKTMDQSGREALRAKNFGNLPILIFSEDPDDPQLSGLPADLARQFAEAWNPMQNQLKGLSTRSRRIIAKGSGHLIPVERPDVLSKEVSIFIQQVRGTLSQPTDYGSTKTE
jgi:pimeloyl-ACP methyl ester carboxylesterase